MMKDDADVDVDEQTSNNYSQKIPNLLQIESKEQKKINSKMESLEIEVMDEMLDGKDDAIQTKSVFLFQLRFDVSMEMME